MYPANDAIYQIAISRVKQRYGSKPRVYVMDGYWDSAHTSADSINNMKNVARAWYDIAHNDAGAILLGIYSWTSFAIGVTGSRDFSCYVLSERPRYRPRDPEQTPHDHRDAGRSSGQHL